jgi:hypothetical protein
MAEVHRSFYRKRDYLQSPQWQAETIHTTYRLLHMCVYHAVRAKATVTYSPSVFSVSKILVT